MFWLDYKCHSVAGIRSALVNGRQRWMRLLACLAVTTAVGGVSACAQVSGSDMHVHNQMEAAIPDYSPTSPGIYDIDIRLTGANNEPISLEKFRGKPLIITMFFTRCPDVCPLMIENILRVKDQIGPEDWNRLNFLFISFDPYDSPEELRAYALSHDIVSPQWTLASAGDEDSRVLGDRLGVRFQAMQNGSYNHSAMVNLIASDGTVLARVPGPSLGSAEFAEAVRALAAM